MSSQAPIQYVDVQWINMNGLVKSNVLDYFYTSPFFDQDSCNQILRRQNLSSSSKVLIDEIGLQYEVDNANSHEPSLYVIRKIHRSSPKSTQLLGIYYCLDGVIYQAPVLLELLRVRYSKAAYHLDKAFDLVRKAHSQELSALLASSSSSSSSSSSDGLGAGAGAGEGDDGAATANDGGDGGTEVAEGSVCGSRISSVFGGDGSPQLKRKKNLKPLPSLLSTLEDLKSF